MSTNVYTQYFHTVCVISITRGPAWLRLLPLLEFYEKERNSICACVQTHTKHTGVHPKHAYTQVYTHTFSTHAYI